MQHIEVSLENIWTQLSDSVEHSSNTRRTEQTAGTTHRLPAGLCSPSPAGLPSLTNWGTEECGQVLLLCSVQDRALAENVKGIFFFFF